MASPTPVSVVLKVCYENGTTSEVTLDRSTAALMATFLGKVTPKPRRLTMSEKGECLVLLEKGWTWAQVAERMALSETELKNQVHYAKRKPGRRIDPARDQMAAMMRRAGRTWNEVADAMGITPDTARRMATRAV